ncbi:MAG: hypothetical protein R2712_28855 [Vicinamibacterales bacterium]
MRAPPALPWVVLTDNVADFADLPVRAVMHTPTGPMAADYVARLDPTGNSQGAAAYHDKRFALRAALDDFATAISWTRTRASPRSRCRPPFHRAWAMNPYVRRSIAEHLTTCGTWRLPAFQELTAELGLPPSALDRAAWCHETCYAVTRDGREARFFEAWERGAALLTERGVFSGEGGVMGLAAEAAGWTVDFDAVAPLFAAIEHEGGGPKAD